jgi:hypothetical protein
MVKTVSFKRLILRAVLRQVSPMVIRMVSVSDQMPLHEFHDVFRTILGWNGDLGYIVRVHGQEINSFRRKTRSKALHEFKLHRQEKFLYICDELFPQDIASMLKARLTFKEAIESPDQSLMSRHRLKVAQRDFYSRLNSLAV